MKRAGVKQAKERLQMAHRHLAALEHVKNHREFEDTWYQFLMAFNAVFSKLEQGAKGIGSSEPWYGMIKHRRKKDELFHYLHQARNSAEHGLERVSERKPGGIGIGKGGETVHGMSFDGNGNITIKAGPKGEIPTITRYPDQYVLTVAIDSLHKDKTDPPRCHQGKKLADNSPQAVASLGLLFAEECIQDANTRIAD